MPAVPAGSFGGNGGGFYGGGGAALGGAIFVRDGGSLSISGGNLAGAYSVTAGAAGGGTATAGQAQGSVMFLDGTGTTAFAITDGNADLSRQRCRWPAPCGLSKSGAGTLALTSANANHSGAAVS